MEQVLDKPAAKWYASSMPTIAELATVAHHATQDATPVARRSFWHGEAHWKDVARYAVRFAHAAGGDPVVAFLFGALHDTQRLSDDSDPHHGLRAMRLAEAMWRDGRLSIGAAQMDLLAYALDGHDRPHTHPDPTVGACWDADRVTLWRVGVVPSARFMSTEAVRQNPRIAYRDLMRNDLDWVQVARSV